MKIYSKIAKIQQELGKLQKDATADAGRYSYNYLTLTELNDHLIPLLSKSNMMIMQPIIKDSVVTQLVDLDDNVIAESSIKLPSDIDPQSLGSAITYYRRYTILSLFNISTEDDDGAKATEKMRSNTAQSPTQSTEYDWRGLQPLKPKSDDEMTWLNIYEDKEKTTFTEDYNRALKALKQGYNIIELRTQWKISRDTATHLEQAAK